MNFEFKEGMAYDFASFVGIRVKQRGDELHFITCPYCKGGKGRDKTTFSINLKTGCFKCLRDSCGVKGNMVTLARDFDFSLGNDFDEYYSPRKTYRKLKTPPEPIKPKPTAIQYMASRGISEETCRKYQITSYNGNEKIIVFPFFDENENLQFVKYRNSEFDPSKDKNKEWCEPNCKPILFGMSQCEDYGTLIVTEGQIDSLSVAEAGFKNAVSVPTGSKGMTWIPYCWNWVNNFSEVVIFGDYEKGHITLLDDFKSRFQIKIRVVRERDYKDCKDANDILKKYGKDQIRTCINHAEPLPIDSVISLDSVEDVDVYQFEKLKTGIYPLDSLLYGGLPFGNVVVISGKPGEGKSTLASQFMAMAIDQGYVCFAYSGELPNHLFKAWFDLQIAGDSHTQEYITEWGNTGYSISKANRGLISKWYHDKFFLYDSDSVGRDKESESLVSVVEKAILRYGVRVILLDNLMTAMTSQGYKGDDQYEKQTRFMDDLRIIAKKFNVLVLLVAHKRKNALGRNENDEIAGSSNISNIASITIAYEKDSDIGEGQRLLKVSKNRLYGKVDTDGWTLDYSERSKRIYSSQKELKREFGCFRDSEATYIDPDNPFV